MEPGLKASLARLLERHPDVALALVFGSIATQKALPDSDLDLAVCGRSKYAPERLVELASEVSRVAGREVDIVDLWDAHGTILEQILTQGVLVIFRSPELWEALMRRQVYEEADFMPLYRRLLRERREHFLER
ncbi:MAG: type VII toxin-antitoxin system MntA family adenylyltransferase antitoxin [Myxococcaceae bacterium]